MAVIQLKGVQVTRLDQNGDGVQVVESNEVNGKTYKTFWKLWFKQPSGLNVGDVVNVSGLHGARSGGVRKDRDGNLTVNAVDGHPERFVDLSVNSPKVEAAAAAAPVAVPAGWTETGESSPF